MNKIRIFISLCVIAFVACIFLVNQESSRRIIREWMQEELKIVTGHNFEIADVEFDFPHSFVLHNVAYESEKYGEIKADKITVKISLIKAFLGSLTGGKVHLEGLSADHADLAALPENVRASFLWDGASTISAEINLLESTKSELPYSLQGGNVTLTLPGKEAFLYTFTSVFPQVKVKEALFNEVHSHGKWDTDFQEGDFSVTAQELSTNGFSLSNVSVGATRDGSSKILSYNVSAAGLYADPFLLDFSGSFSPTLFQLDQFHLSSDEHSLALKNPLVLQIRDNLHVDLAYGHFIFDQREVVLSGNAGLDTVDLKFELPKQFFTSSSVEQAPFPVEGFLSGALSLQGAISDLQARVELSADLTAIEHPSIEKGALFQVKFSGTLAGNTVGFQGELFDRNAKLLEMKGFCPIVRTSAFTIEPSKTADMAMNLIGYVDISRYIQAFISPKCWLTGEASYTFNVKGPFHKPLLTGNAKFKNGSFESWETGTLLQNIEGDFLFTNDKISLRSLSALDYQGGRIMASGAFELDPISNYPFHVNISLDHCAVVSLDNIETLLSGDAIFSGDAKGAILKGELTTNSLDILLTEQPSAINHNIEVIYTNQSAKEIPPTRITKPAVDWPICFDFHIQNKGGIFIHSKELSSEWKGDVKVAGCTTQPLLYGDFRVLKGEYLFNGKKFKISEGSISFAGEISKKTLLYVVGEMEIDPIVAQVVLKGPLNNPSLLFRSTPPLAQREILSWILFGRGMGEITPYQGAELTQSINELKDTGGSNPSFLTRFKESLGIDRIDFHNGEGKDDISVQVGKYITPELFLGIKRDSTSNRIGIEANVMKNVKIQAEVGDDAEGHLHLKWKHDY